jgi:PAS domain S-box-containing protein
MGLKSTKNLMHAFQKMTEGIEGYTLILLDFDGTILTWNKGVQKLKGYTSEEIIGQHVSMFYLPEDRNSLPKKLLQEAEEKGRVLNIGRRIRKNGTIFWGSVEIVSIKDDNGNVIGFTNLVRELNDETELGHFWFDNDGILHTRASNATHTPEKIAEFRELLKGSLHNGKLCCIADIREAILTDGGMNFSIPDLNKLYKAVAYISDSNIDANTQRVISVMPKDIPTKVFTTRESAKSWIKQYL